MITMRLPLAALALLFAVSANANMLTGTIDRLQVEGPSNGGYLMLTGFPTFESSGCSSSWAAGSLDDEKFMIYFWPMLMSAKREGKSVTIQVNGCIGPYPRITLVQVNAT